MTEAKNTEAPARPHSEIGASSAHRWLECPGSVALSRDLPKRSSEEADEGTAHHTIASDCLGSNQDAWEHVGRVVEVGDEEGGVRRSFVIDDAGAEAVQVYLNAIRGDIAEYATGPSNEPDWGTPPRVFVEQGFHLVHVDEGAYGTADCAVHFPDWKLLRVYDYKHGKGLAVDVVENPQLLYYALGALVELASGEVNLGDIEDVELVVVQPRCTSGDTLVHRWRTTKDYVTNFMHNVLRPGIAKTREPNAPLKAGDHCRFCPAKQAGVCPVLNKALDRAIEDVATTGGLEHTEAQAQETLQHVAKSLETWELSEKLEQVPLLRFAIKTLEQEAERRLLAGEDVPGFKLVNKKADRVWAEGGFEAAVEKYGAELCYERKGKTPAAIERLEGGKEFVKGRAFKPDTGLTLASTSDKRVGVTVRPAADRFIGIKTS
jgi:hypothetical protein